VYLTVLLAATAVIPDEALGRKRGVSLNIGFIPVTIQTCRKCSSAENYFHPPNGGILHLRYCLNKKAGKSIDSKEYLRSADIWTMDMSSAIDNTSWI
jgi:hypothetical protein